MMHHYLCYYPCLCQKFSHFRLLDPTNFGDANTLNIFWLDNDHKMFNFLLHAIYYITVNVSVVYLREAIHHQLQILVWGYS